MSRNWLQYSVFYAVRRQVTWEELVARRLRTSVSHCHQSCRCHDDLISFSSRRLHALAARLRSDTIVALVHGRAQTTRPKKWKSFIDNTNRKKSTKRRKVKLHGTLCAPPIRVFLPLVASEVWSCQLRLACINLINLFTKIILIAFWRLWLHIFNEISYY